MKKAKADGADGAAGSDDSLTGESLTGGQSVLEISGPTIPSPGPSGVTRQRKTAWDGGERDAFFNQCLCVGQVAGGITTAWVGLGPRSASAHGGSTLPPWPAPG